MSPLESLGRQIAAEQDVLLEQAHDLEPVRERILGRSAPEPQRRGAFPRRLAFAGALISLALLAALLLFRRPGPQPITFTVGPQRAPGVVGQWLSAAAAEPLGVEFSDGTRFSLGPSARARIITLDHSGAGIVVESGRAEFVVIPKPTTSFRVTLGPFAVNVTGTRFSVAFYPEAQLLELKLDEGRVTVSGCVFGDGRPVVAGETVRASCKEGRMEITSGRVETAERSPSSGSTASTASSSLPPAHGAGSSPKAVAKRVDDGPPPEQPDWRKLAESGDYRSALAAADAIGFEALCQSVSAAELLLLGDAARFAGEPAKAEHAYLTLRKRFAGDSRAAVAAFMLARVASDQRGSSADAARWLDTYLAQQPEGPLAREARGRLIEARERTGDHDGARRAARDYIARYPEGPHAELAQRLLGE